MGEKAHCILTFLILALCTCATTNSHGDPKVAAKENEEESYGCDKVEPPRFESIQIDSPNIVDALRDLEKKAAAIYLPQDHTPILNIFDLSDRAEKRIKYFGENKTLPEVILSLLELNSADFHFSRNGGIWLGVSEQAVQKISEKYPIELEHVILPMIMFEEERISKVEDTMEKLWQEYNPWQNSNSYAWTMNTGRLSNRRISLKCMHVDFRSVVTYMDLVSESGPNHRGR